MAQAANPNFDPVHLAAPDPRADGEVRHVTLHATHVQIRRHMAGIAMKIAIPTPIYHGVLLSLEPMADMQCLYRVSLIHGDAELDVVLAEGGEAGPIQEAWTQWSLKLGLPRLVERSVGEYTRLDNPPIDALDTDSPGHSRRKRILLARRSRFARRRKTGQTPLVPETLRRLNHH
ncbi:MAG: hypothetical protein KGQ46_04680 [Hyphomicrobiales bacterium]|nr:hypothetical protein [Hyphomicrobiales bacterium]MDE2114600.1 hypothetical protein [Hyphomicrobiales bacterium]